MREIQAIDVPECGNAPRREVIRDLVLALSNRDADALTPFLADNVAWDVVGQRELAGLDEVVTWLGGLEELSEVRFRTILTHGREGGVDGTVTTTGGRSFGFAHVFGFVNTAKTAKIKLVRTYLVATD